MSARDWAEARATMRDAVWDFMDQRETDERIRRIFEEVLAEIREEWTEANEGVERYA